MIELPFNRRLREQTGRTLSLDAFAHLAQRCELAGVYLLQFAYPIKGRSERFADGRRCSCEQTHQVYLVSIFLYFLFILEECRQGLPTNFRLLGSGAPQPSVIAAGCEISVACGHAAKHAL